MWQQPLEKSIAYVAVFDVSRVLVELSAEPEICDFNVKVSSQ